MSGSKETHPRPDRWGGEENILDRRGYGLIFLLRDEVNSAIAVSLLYVSQRSHNRLGENG